MSLEENKALVLRLVEAWNTRNLAVHDELMAPDCMHAWYDRLIRYQKPLCDRKPFRKECYKTARALIKRVHAKKDRKLIIQLRL